MNAYTQDIFELVLARPVMHVTGDDPMQVHLWWRAPQQGDRLVQVYVNDALYDVTAWPTQRAMWLLLDRARSHRIELLAVDPTAVDSVWQAQPGLLQAWSPRVADVAALHIMRDETLPADARFRLNVNDESAADAPLWPGDVGRDGFGALFGQGGFGSDAVAGPGLGEGELGVGPLGSDGTAWRWRDDSLPAGEHALELHVHDPTGQPLLSAPLHQPISIERLPAPAERVQLDPPDTLRWQ